MKEISHRNNRILLSNDALTLDYAIQCIKELELISFYLVRQLEENGITPTYLCVKPLVMGSYLTPYNTTHTNNQREIN